MTFSFRQPGWFWLSLIGLAFWGLCLRVYPGRDHLLWNTSDYARDAYTARQMVTERDIKLLGPRAEVYSPRLQTYAIYHGPLYYYFIAPWYALGQGDPNVPLLASIVFHLSAMIPLGLLSYGLFKKREAVVITLLLFTTAYEQIEYSRWLLNPALAVPWLAWFFYFLWKVITQKTGAFWLGVVLGLAIQSEIFLGYWLLVSLVMFGVTRQNWKQWLAAGAGLTLGLLPLILSEFKFHFRMTQSLWWDFVLGGQAKQFDVWALVVRWQAHWGVVSRQVLFAMLPQLALLGVLLLIAGGWWIARRQKAWQPAAQFLSLLVVAPLVIFVIKFENSIYADVGVGLAFILWATLVFVYCWQKNRGLAVVGVLLVLLGQLQLLRVNTQQQTPFGGYFFLSSDTLLFSQKLAIVEQVYQEVGSQPFSLSVLDTPYGWSAVWASVFEQYSLRTGRPLPRWYGFYVRGIPGDGVFTTTDTVLPVHVVMRPQTVLVDEQTQRLFYELQDSETEVVKVLELEKYRVEIRKRK